VFFVLSLYYNSVRRCFNCKFCDFYWELEDVDPLPYSCPVCDSRHINQMDSASFDKWNRINCDSRLFDELYGSSLTLQDVWDMADCELLKLKRR